MHHHNERGHTRMSICDCDTPDLCGSQGYCNALHGRLPWELRESEAERTMRRLFQITVIWAAGAVGALLLILAWRAIS